MQEARFVCFVPLREAEHKTRRCEGTERCEERCVQRRIVDAIRAEDGIKVATKLPRGIDVAPIQPERTGWNARSLHTRGRKIAVNISAQVPQPGCAVGQAHPARQSGTHDVNAEKSCPCAEI